LPKSLVGLSPGRSWSDLQLLLGNRIEASKRCDELMPAIQIQFAENRGQLIPDRNRTLAQPLGDFAIMKALGREPCAFSLPRRQRRDLVRDACSLVGRSIGVKAQ